MEVLFATLIANTTGKVRREVLDGRSYLVAPMTLIVSGVLPGSKGPLYYPPEEIRKSASQWNDVPITVYHPYVNGMPSSAKGQGVLDRQGIGLLKNSSWDEAANKLRAEGWVDEERAKTVDRRVYDKLVNGEPIELSTGLYTTNDEAPSGSHHQGRPYTHVARDYRSDHLAILPDQVGACSINDGCGVLVNAKQEQSMPDDRAPRTLWADEEDDTENADSASTPASTTGQTSTSAGAASSVAKYKTASSGTPTGPIGNREKLSVWQRLGRMLGLSTNDAATVVNGGLGRGNHAAGKRVEHANALSEKADAVSDGCDGDEDKAGHKRAYLAHKAAAEAHMGASKEAANASSTKAESDYTLAGTHQQKMLYHQDKADEHGRACGMVNNSSTHNSSSMSLSASKTQKHDQDVDDDDPDFVPDKVKKDTAWKPDGKSKSPLKRGSVEGTAGEGEQDSHQSDTAPGNSGAKAAQGKVMKHGQMIDNAWSDAARQAAAEARKAHGATKQGGESITESDSAHKSSDKANESGSSKDHRKAAGDHEAAAMMHEEYADVARQDGNHEQAKKHDEAVKAHVGAMKEHLAARRVAMKLEKRRSTPIGNELNRMWADVMTANEFESDDQREAFFGHLKAGKFGKGGAEAAGKSEEAHDATKAASEHADKRSQMASKAGGAERRAHEHGKAADAHNDAGKAHWQAMKSSTDQKVKDHHAAAAKEHFAKAKEHGAKAKELSGTHNTNTMRLNVTRRQVVAALTANCSCAETRNAIERMSDDVLKTIWNAKNADPDEEDDEEDKDPGALFAKNADKDDDDLFGKGSDPDDGKGASSSGGGHGSMVGDFAVGRNRTRNADVDSSNADATEDAKTKSRMAAKADEEDNDNPIAGETDSVKAGTEKKMNLNQWLAKMPEEAREVFNEGMEARRERKIALVKRIIANVHSDPERKRLGAKYMRWSMEDLKDLVKTMGPTANINDALAPLMNQQLAPLFLGQAGADFTGNSYEDSERSDVLELPVMNWHEIAAV